MKKIAIILAFVAAVASTAAAQVVQGTGAGSTLRVTVLDQTDAALIIAQVTLVDSKGIEQTLAVDDRGVAEFTALNPGPFQVKASADSPCPPRKMNPKSVEYQCGLIDMTQSIAAAVIENA